MASHHEKSRFSERLQTALEKAGHPVTSPTAVARRFNMLYPDEPVSVQAVRRWLEGSAIPSQDKLVVLARWLRVAPDWLRYGEREEVATSRGRIAEPMARYDTDMLPSLVELLSEENQAAMLRVVVALLLAEGKLTDP